jgi:cytochrome c oxidase subunit IV
MVDHEDYPMNAPATSHAHADHQPHAVPLWGLFLALLALTAAEVGLFEFWHYTAQHHAEPIFPKAVMVALLLVMTLPKAAIVMVYFMHLKFERPLVVFLAVLPLLMVFICVVPSLSDIVSGRMSGRTVYEPQDLPAFDPTAAHGDHEDASHAVDEHADSH